MGRHRQIACHCIERTVPSLFPKRPLRLKPTFVLDKKSELYWPDETREELVRRTKHWSGECAIPLANYIFADVPQVQQVQQVQFVGEVPIDIPTEEERQEMLQMYVGHDENMSEDNEMVSHVEAPANKSKVADAQLLMYFAEQAAASVDAVVDTSVVNVKVKDVVS
jgi:hypothetical protein